MKTTFQLFAFGINLKDKKESLWKANLKVNMPEVIVLLALIAEQNQELK